MTMAKALKQVALYAGLLLLCFGDSSTAQRTTAKHNLGVIILDQVFSNILDEYRNAINCTLYHETRSTISNNTGFSLVYLPKTQYSPKGILDTLCKLRKEISTVAVILPALNTDLLAIYKYLVNHISSLGIPIIVWNSHQPKDKVFDSIVQLSPQIEQQAEAHISLLLYYEWTKFSILTTRCSGYVEYTSAVRRLVGETVNKKGEQLLELLSSHEIARIDNVTVYKALSDLKKADARVILLHMTGTEIVQVMKAAEALDMVGKEYMWIGSTRMYSGGIHQAQQLPLGMIALKYDDGDYTNEVPYMKAVLSTADLWRDSITRFLNKYPDASPPIKFPCTSDDAAEFWEDGKRVFQSIVGHHTESKDIKGCGRDGDYVLTLPMDIDEDGMNKKVKLQYINIAYSTQRKSGHHDGSVDKDDKIWKTIGSWYSPNVTELDDITWPGNSPIPPDGVPARSFLRVRRPQTSGHTRNGEIQLANNRIVVLLSFNHQQSMTIVPPWLEVVTHEEAPYVKFTDPDPVTGKCETIGSERVRLTNITKDSCPDTACRGNASLFQCATGLCIDLLNKLKEDMKFDYELVRVRDNQWGNYIDAERTQWNGVVRDLIDGVADISMTTLKIGPERSEAIDFSIPFIETGITIIVLIKKGVISATAFLEPYKYTVWATVCSALSLGIGITIFVFEWASPTGLVSLHRRSKAPEPYDLYSWIVVLVAAVHGMGTLVLIFDYWSPSGKDVRPQFKAQLMRRSVFFVFIGERFSLARSLWLIWSTLFGAAVGTDNTKGIASRFLVAIWALFSLVFLASYTANLAAFMITKEEYIQLEGINDYKLKRPLSLKPPFRFATVPDGSTALNLVKNHPSMFEYMKPFNKKNVKSGIEAVKNNELQAFIYDATVLEYEASRDEDCKLTTVGSWYAMTGYGVGFPKASKWKKPFDIHLTKYINDGYMDRLRKFWLTGACKKPTYGKGKESSHSLDIANFTSAYILLMVGLALSVILLLSEHVYFTVCRRKLRKIDKCGICSLISLSMGESLSFEDSVMEVLEATRNNLQCSNELCKANQARLNHELDVAICRLNMIHASINRNAGQSSAPKMIPESLQGRKSPQGSPKRQPRQKKLWNKTIKFSSNDDTIVQKNNFSCEPSDAEQEANEQVEPLRLKANEQLVSVESCL